MPFRQKKEISPSLAPERPSIQLALSILQANNRLNFVPAEDRSIMNPALEKLICELKRLPGTPTWKKDIKDTFMYHYPQGNDSNGNFNIAEQLGINLQRGLAGACSLGEARLFELRRFLIIIPAIIDGQLGQGELTNAQKNYIEFSQWSQEFKDVYHENAFPDENNPSERNLRLIFKDSMEVDRWMTRHQRFVKAFPPLPMVDSDHISP